MEAILTPSPKRTRQTKSPELEIIEYIKKFTHLDETEVRGILDSIRVKSFKKGEVLLREGQTAHLCYFVLKGCVRQYFLVDGDERTTNFYTEGQPITPHESNFKRKPSKFYLECLEDSILTVGTPDDEARLFQKFPHLEAISRVAVEEELGKSQESFVNFILDSPEERYRRLLETRPDLLERVPQYQLASYLGITPESLSRIRKRIMAK